MKKIICILLVVCLLLVIGRFAIRYFDFQNTNSGNNQKENNIVNASEEMENIKESKFKNSDEIYVNYFNKQSNELVLLESKDINSEYFNDDEWKKLFNQNEVQMTINKYKLNDNKVLDIIPFPDTLFEYIIIEETNNNYGVFSHISQGTGEEVYRYYINNDIILKKIESKYEEKEKITTTNIEKSEIDNTLLLYNYYINL